MRGTAVIAALAALAVAGCTPRERGDQVSAPPEVPAVVHGYETQDGGVVRYSEVDTGVEAGPGGSGSGDYSDRATAR